MRKVEILMRKLWIENKKFVNSIFLKDLCEKLGVEYENMIRYLLGRGYLVRIFRGIFYVKSLEEIKFGKLNLSHLELIAGGMKNKGVKNWYFGLHTALRLNGVTHEYFPVEFILNDKIFRAKEVKIAGHRFKFIRIKPSLFFGIIEKDELRYSDLEKTILDFIYLWRYRSVPEEKIVLDVSELFNKASKDKLFRYSEKYPKTVKRNLEMMK
ncbi:MAG: type IV toxin-antitoxin system AbiEi family antitoxin domain-containing protein [Candidatus Asgardarchaeia archaeon]